MANVRPSSFFSISLSPSPPLFAFVFDFLMISMSTARLDAAD